MARKGLWTPANVVTCIRVALVPVWLLIAELAMTAGLRQGILWIVTAIFFILLSLTDKLDGYLARSRNEVTVFGKFLDPIADKLVVVVALVFLLQVGSVHAVVILIVVAREFLVSGLRMVVASAGTVIAASNLGKWKTATTMMSIAGLLLGNALQAFPFPPGFLYTEAYGYILAATWALMGVSQVLLWIAVALTAWSGVDYFVKAWPCLSAPEEDGDGHE